MADLWTTAFLPDGWDDFRELLDAIVCDGAALYRWEEWSHEDGARVRAAHLVRDEGGPTLEAIGHTAIERAHGLGFRVASVEEENLRTVLHGGDRTLGIGFRPFPRQVVIDLHDKMTTRGAAQYPAIQELVRLVAASGAARFARLHRFAELDVEQPDRFYPPTTEMVCRGTYDGARLCESLTSAGFFEDGDAWLREGPVVRSEVRLRDGEVQAAVLPAHLAR